ncbi:MAG: guanylate kinase [Eubacteriales bacterium]|nr:guanylate kinase [Eubacteriales bacterium]
MAGKLAVISGFSGAGKGTVIKKLMDAHEGYVLSISMTTRRPRDGEKDGREYFFATKEAFDELIKNDGFLEYAVYTDCSYGTPREFVLRNLREGRDVLLEIEVQGAMQIREKFPEAVLIFIVPPDAAELERRLVGRGTDSQDKITRRLRRAIQETGFIPEYPSLLINADADACAEAVHAVIHGIPEQGPDPEQPRTIITDYEEKKAVAQAFREALPGILARRS